MIFNDVKHFLMQIVWLTLWALSCRGPSSREITEIPKAIDPDFTYLASDPQALLSVKYVPQQFNLYSKTYENLKSSGESPDDYILLGQIAYALRKDKDVNQLGKAALTGNFRNEGAKLLLATQALKKSQLDLAQIYLNQIEGKEEDTNKKNLQALIWHRQGKNRQAVDLLRQLWQLDSKHFAVGMNLGLILLDLRRLHDAEEVFQQLATRFPKSDDAAVHLAISRGMKGNHQVVISAMQPIATRYPTNPLVHAVLALSQARNGQKGLALKTLNAAIQRANSSKEDTQLLLQARDEIAGESVALSGVQ